MLDLAAAAEKPTAGRYQLPIRVMWFEVPVSERDAFIGTRVPPGSRAGNFAGTPDGARVCEGCCRAPGIVPSIASLKSLVTFAGVRELLRGPYLSVTMLLLAVAAAGCAIPAARALAVDPVRVLRSE